MEVWMRGKTFLSMCGAVLLSLLAAVSASAFTFDLMYEFDGALPVKSYGTVNVTQNGSYLDIEILANTMALGMDADISKFYFNLLDGVTGLTIVGDDAPFTPYALTGPNPPVTGGAGSSFDWRVDLGNGGGNKGNAILQRALFTLSADSPLVIADLFEFSYPNNTPPVNVAVHFQGTSTPFDSETVGGAVPIPATIWLLGAGLAALVGIRRRNL